MNSFIYLDISDNILVGITSLTNFTTYVSLFTKKDLTPLLQFNHDQLCDGVSISGTSNSGILALSCYKGSTPVLIIYQYLNEGTKILYHIEFEVGKIDILESFSTINTNSFYLVISDEKKKKIKFYNYRFEIVESFLLKSFKLITTITHCKLFLI